MFCAQLHSLSPVVGDFLKQKRVLQFKLRSFLCELHACIIVYQRTADSQLDLKQVNTLELGGNYSDTSNDMKFGTLAVDGWVVSFGTARRGMGGAPARPCPSSLYQIVTAYPSTTSVPVTVLLFNGRLLCGFNVSIKGSE